MLWKYVKIEKQPTECNYYQEQNGIEQSFTEEVTTLSKF